jgi:methyl-accepting chemotaxis protein
MFARLRIGQKIVASFLLAIAIAAALALLAYTSAQRTAAAVKELTTVQIPSIIAMDAINEAHTDIWGATNGLSSSILGTPEIRKALLKRIDDAQGRIDAARKQYEPLPMSPAEAQGWKELQATWRQWEEPTRTVRKLVEEKDQLLASGMSSGGPRLLALDTQMLDTLREAQKLAQEVSDKLAAITEINRREATALQREAEEGSSRANTLLVAGVALAAVALLVLGWLLSRSIGAIIGGLAREAKKLTDAVDAGQLRVRGDAAATNFEFRGIVEGMNRTMDAFQKPIEVTADYVSRISKGDVPPKITDSYQGDFNAIKNALNTCVEAVNALVADAQQLSTAAMEGKLKTRADVSRHHGDFRKIVQGVNGTLDAVLAPIEEAAEVLEKLAARDLRARVKSAYQGEHAKIKEALNATAEALHDSLAQVAQAVSQVSSASAQIAASSQSVADGASEQASSLEETSSQLESMSSVTKQATDNAFQANGLAQNAKGAATEGAAAMDQMSGAMRKIKASAEGTSQIIKDINEIAFQTNLLALNAAVEAARAGEAGRGFAVVAEEVRSLALRSKEAATKTEELIRQSVKEAGEGEVTSKHVSAKLAEIVTGITKVSDIVAEITASSKEQAQGIEQVNKAVTQMDKVTQQNAANSEESSSAAAELSGQAQELAAMVGSFQLERTASAPARAPAVRATPPVAARAAAPAVTRAAPRPATQGSRKNGVHGNGATALRPEQLIPLDDEQVFKAF